MQKKQQGVPRVICISPHAQPLQENNVVLILRMSPRRCHRLHKSLRSPLSHQQADSIR